ncbi:branched-chain-amino-acid transaminase [soil metagenome]
MAVFETIAVWQGGLCLLNAHVNRLERACHDAGFLLPPDLVDSVTAIFLGRETGLLRVYLTGGDGSPLAACTESRCYAIFEQMVFPTVEQIEKGWRLGISRAPIPTILGGWKTACYWPHIHALAEAQRNSCNEAIVCNAAGAVVSASMANVFFVIRGTLHTPALSCGARDGVVREWVRTHHPVEEAQLSVDDLAEVEECFLTNSRIGLMPVFEIDGRALPSRQTGLTLAKSYREEVLG